MSGQFGVCGAPPCPLAAPRARKSGSHRYIYLLNVNFQLLYALFDNHYPPLRAFASKERILHTVVLNCVGLYRNVILNDVTSYF